MHPAPSVIVFSTLSGAGFGLLVWLGLGLPAVTGWAAFGLFALAYVLAVGGLIAATLHLGHPERAWRAFSQWRTSWLSREGVAAVACLIVMAAYGAGLVFWGTRLAALGWLGAGLALFTVLTTAMIYAQLKAVPRWHHWSTPALLLLLSLGGGAVLSGQNLPAALLLLAAAGVQLYWWQDGDLRFARAGTTLASATGLGPIGSVRAFEPPHTGPNYLLTEMAFQIGRRHAGNLRSMALTFGYGVPILLMLAPQSPWLTAIAALAHLSGILVSRWLFFAQAEHVVALYYGKH